MNIKLKSRPGGRTFQIITSVYCPNRKRSATKTLGSIPITADPNDFEHELKLRPGVLLTPAHYETIRHTLLTRGCTIAAAWRITLREAVRRQIEAEGGKDPFAHLERALDELTAALPELARQYPDPEVRWAALRDKYLACHRAYEQFLEAAKAAGIAKQRARKAEEVEA